MTSFTGSIAMSHSDSQSDSDNLSLSDELGADLTDFNDQGIVTQPTSNSLPTDANPRTLHGYPSLPVVHAVPPESAGFARLHQPEELESMLVEDGAAACSRGSNLEKDYMPDDPPPYNSLSTVSRPLPPAQSVSGASGATAVSAQTDPSSPRVSHGDSHAGARPKQRQPTAAATSTQTPSGQGDPLRRQGHVAAKDVHPSPADVGNPKPPNAIGSLRVDLPSVKSVKSKPRVKDSSTSSMDSKSANRGGSSRRSSSSNRLDTSSTSSSDSSYSKLDLSNSSRTSAASSCECKHTVRSGHGQHSIYTCTHHDGPNRTTSYSFTANGTNTITINNRINMGHRHPYVTQSTKRSSPNLSKVKIPAKGNTLGNIIGSKRRLSTEDVEILSRELGDSWFRVGLSIGVKKGVLENIRYQYERDRDQTAMAREMLKKWQAKFGRNATINYVIDALTDKDFGLYDVAAALPED